MSALAQDGSIVKKGAHRALRLAGPVVADDIVYADSFVGLASGVLRPLQAGDKFFGLVERRVDNTGGAASAAMVDVETGLLIDTTVTGASATSVGLSVYATNDNPADCTLTLGSNSLVGVVEQHISGTRCWVRLYTPGEATKLAALEARVKALEDA